ncbi:MAG: DUF2071 domain-containing protein [Deltaproteobacteria bacterium]|nr:DUF2071 domain-containing protein [Deltaproteobacteria bacterium]
MRTLPEEKPFLTAEWRYLVMLNYEIDPAVLQPYVPFGTELDDYKGRTFASMVGFLFYDTRVLGVSIPFHRNFEEINLRFYVKREVGQELRCGVVFIKEIVPRRAIAWIANALYGENYVALRTRGRLEFESFENISPSYVSYEWRHKGKWSQLSLSASGAPQELAAGSEEEFITEHYWGYTRRSPTQTTEYRVHHPRWRIWRAESHQLTCDISALYGENFAGALSQQPASAFLAEGSEVAVYKGRALT